MSKQKCCLHIFLLGSFKFKYYFALLSSLFWLFLFSSSYYKFATRSLPFYAYFSYTKKALSLSLNFFFHFLLDFFSLHFYLRLMNVCVF